MSENTAHETGSTENTLPILFNVAERATDVSVESKRFGSEKDTFLNGSSDTV